MPSAQKRFQSLTRKLDNQDYAYDVLRMGKSPVVSIGFGGEPRHGHFHPLQHVGHAPFGQLDVYVIFDESGEEVHFQTSPLVRVASGDRLGALDACNRANNHYRWLKFNLNSDNNIVGHYDLPIDSKSAADTCLTLVQRILEIVDDALPQLQELSGGEAARESLGEGDQAAVA